jgi:hypothetical protein
MRVRLGLATLAPWRMHAEIRHHAPRYELLTNKIPRQRDSLGLAELAWQGEFHLPRQLRVLAALAHLHRVPQGAAIGPGHGRAIGQQHLSMHHLLLAGEIVREAGAGVLQPRRRAIGCRCHHGASGTARDHLRREVVDRHAARSPGSGIGESIVAPPTDSPFRDVAADDV